MNPTERVARIPIFSSGEDYKRLRDCSSHEKPIVWAHLFFKNSLGIMLTNFNKSTDFNQVRRQSQAREKSKKQLLSRAIGTYKPERSGFVFINDDLI